MHFPNGTLRNRFEHLAIIGVFVGAEMYLLSSLSFRLQTNPQTEACLHTHTSECIGNAETHAPPDHMDPLFSWCLF